MQTVQVHLIIGTTLVHAKFWQYANQVSNAHGLHKMVLEG